MPPRAAIHVRGAREHNLKGIDVEIPLGALTVITGVSGSGKSSLALDTLYAEGQRRYVESFSAYARQFLERLERPDVDAVDGLLPAVAIERAGTLRGSRSTVGTLTELLDHLKLLWAKVGELDCPGCGRSVERESPERVARRLLALAPGRRLVIAFERLLPPGATPADLAQDLAAAGFPRVLSGDETLTLAPDGSNLPPGPLVAVVVDRLVTGQASRTRLVDSLELAFKAGGGSLLARLLGQPGPSGQPLPSEDLRFSSGLTCASCRRTFRAPTPNLFSFNSPLGACATCHGFGRTTGVDRDLVVPDPALSLAKGAIRPFQLPSKRTWRRRLLLWAAGQELPTDRPWRDLSEEQRRWVMDGGPGGWEGVAGFFRGLEEKSYKVHVRVLIARFRGYPLCTDCHGARLAEEGRAWRVGGRTLPEALALDVAAARAFFEALAPPPGAEEVVDLLLSEIRSRLTCLDDVGLSYVTLDRQARTLSGGEVQRVNLTAALGSNLVNTLFVLDEPSVGLHPRDNDRLVRMLRRLCEQGNTVVVVEHDPAILAAADHLIDLGPGAGEAGGRLVASGTPAEVRRVPASLTGAWLDGRRRVEEPPRSARRKVGPLVGVKGARAHNLRGVDLLVRLGELTGLSGVSGSGKSSLARDVFHLALAREKGEPEGTPGPHASVVGAEHIDAVVLVDQTALTATSRANPATFLGAWDGVRALFAKSPAAKKKRFTPSTFSFNVEGGRCARCAGEGRERVEMQFLSDVEVPCEECGGRRFRSEVLAIEVDGLSVADVLDLSASAACERFAGQRAISGPLAPLVEVGLGYLRLGQPLSTLSAGEAQRLRLAAALAEPARRRRHMYVFDEPTTGLHLEDVATLLKALRRLADRGHGVLLVEHHLDVLWACDRVLDLGPGGGPDGGSVVADGTPAEVAAGEGETARFLRAHRDPKRFVIPAATPKRRAPATDGLIRVRGAREHNLRDLDVDIPRDAFVVVSGPSGSGKSTLAFDIVFAEGQRRYIQTLSAYARQFVGQLSRPDLDHVSGIPPTVAIEQRRTRGGRRSTVATVTEVAHYLRLLFARCGVPHCPACGRELRALTPVVLVDRLVEEHKGEELRLFAPVVLGRKGHHREVFEAMTARGHVWARVDGRVVAADPPPTLDRYQEHDIEEEVVRVTPGKTPTREVLRAVEAALALGKGVLVALRPNGSPRALSVTRTCPKDGITVPEPDPRLFSHNSRRGWCPACQGLGTRPQVDAATMPIEPERTLRQGPITPLNVDAGLSRTFVREAQAMFGIAPSTRWRTLDAVTRRRLLKGADTPKGRFVGAAERFETFLAGCPDIAIDWFGAYATRRACPDCQGQRLRPEARAVKVGGQSLPQLLAEPAAGLLAALTSLRLSGRDAAVAVPVMREVEERIGFLERVGLGYLTLDRDATTLSGGESQRIRLAASLGSHLRGVCYVLDEPTIGLHPRDNARLLEALTELRWRGNSLLVVEHDVETIRRADHIIDLGPGGGRQGGRVVATGSPAALAKNPDSPTGRVLARGAPPPPPEPPEPSAWLTIEGARLHNLEDLDVRVPLGRLVAVTGVSGSGKSTLVREVLVEGLTALAAKRQPAACARILGAGALTRVLEVDATPVGKTPRSVPATYLGIWDVIRDALSRTVEARTRGYGPGRFSFNVPGGRGGGRCEACEGRGRITVEMSFLPDVETPCEACHGARFTEETCEVRWHGLSAAQLLALTFAEAEPVFRDVPRIAPFVRLMDEVGLGYLALGQSSTTLSGGEAQRLKLVTELGRPAGEGRTLYVLDEPTTGLHGEDVDRLLAVLRRFVDRGDTVLVIEHHLDLVARCDHLIDLGPEGGAGGGQVVVAGTVREVAASAASHTGAALRALYGGALPPVPIERLRSATGRRNSFT